MNDEDESGIDAYLVCITEHYAVYFNPRRTQEIKEYRVMLWHRLSQMRPLFSQTYTLTNGVGPEKLRLPPYSPENSIVYLTVF